MNQTYPIRFTTSQSLLFLGLVATLLACGSLPAQARDLSEQTIRSFIETLKAAETLEPELESLNETPGNGEDADAPDFSRIFSDSLQTMRGEPAYKRLEDLVQDHGFSDLQQWATTGDRIYRAWMAIEMESQSPAAQQEMASAMAEIENSPHMTEAQKAQMRAMMENAASAMQSAQDAPRQDIEAVRPHVYLLREFSESE